MPKTRLNWLILIAVVALLGAAWIAVHRVDAAQTGLDGRPPSPEVGAPAPDFTLLTPEGETLTLSDLRGQPVVLNFWATWCPPCRAEVPALEQVSRELGEDVTVLGVNVQEDRGAVQAFIDELEMTYPVVLDPSAEVARAYLVRAFPTTYFIDSRGVIAYTISGPLNEPLIYTRLSELAGR